MERQSVYSQAGVLSQNGDLEGKEERREGGGKEEMARKVSGSATILCVNVLP